MKIGLGLHRRQAAVAFVAAAVLAAAAVWGYAQLQALGARVASLETTLASTTALLVGVVEETEGLSETLTREKEALEHRLGSVVEQVGTISGAVGTLEKLSRTDPELLQKYSKVFFLNEHYAPERVADIEPAYLYHERNPEVIHASVWPKLKSLLDAAEGDGVELYVFSAYRSFDEQRALKGAYTVTYGAGTANQFSADQGYSEHQLGTALDFITTGLSGRLAGFDKTPAYEWLLEHAHEYGFILSYPRNNNHYIFEPWHWRYVGVELATELHRRGVHFYDLDQREIDQYLVELFD